MSSSVPRKRGRLPNALRGTPGVTVSNKITRREYAVFQQSVVNAINALINRQKYLEGVFDEVLTALRTPEPALDQTETSPSSV